MVILASISEAFIYREGHTIAEIGNHTCWIATKNLYRHSWFIKAAARRDATGALEEHNESEISYCACA